ncbi:DUF2243 domain-containing protein [Natronococcus wangiae]|uniref:DUF2243 domain-containing protein n=1 Tax=Natronococcus wangiae TaxID=3068275 RepID=UPI00273EDF0F|nr:DUF2243 domain-containing protein [Natronococcus sp. AD5]
MHERTDAMLNGALIVIGAAAVIDNIVFHWLLGWHRVIEGVPDPEMFLLELGIVLIGIVLFSLGTWREYTARS